LHLTSESLSSCSSGRCGGSCGSVDVIAVARRGPCRDLIFFLLFFSFSSFFPFLFGLFPYRMLRISLQSHRESLIAWPRPRQASVEIPSPDRSDEEGSWTTTAISALMPTSLPHSPCRRRALREQHHLRGRPPGFSNQHHRGSSSPLLRGFSSRLPSAWTDLRPPMRLHPRRGPRSSNRPPKRCLADRLGPPFWSLRARRATPSWLV